MKHLKRLSFVGCLLMLCGCEFGLPDQTNPVLQFNGNFSGVWKATEVEDRLSASAVQCAATDFSIDQTTSSFIVSQRKFTCGAGANTYIKKWDRLSLIIDGDDLRFQGQPAGRIASNYVSIDINLPTGGYWTLRIDQVGNSFQYRETISGASSTEATLSR